MGSASLGLSICSQGHTHSIYAASVLQLFITGKHLGLGFGARLVLMTADILQLILGHQLKRITGLTSGKRVWPHGTREKSSEDNSFGGQACDEVADG